MAGMAVEPDDEAVAIARMISEGAPDLLPPVVRVRRMTTFAPSAGRSSRGPLPPAGRAAFGIAPMFVPIRQPMCGQPNGARRGRSFARIASLVDVRAKGRRHPHGQVAAPLVAVRCSWSPWRTEPAAPHQAVASPRLGCSWRSRHYVTRQCAGSRCRVVATPRRIEDLLARAITTPAAPG